MEEIGRKPKNYKYTIRSPKLMNAKFPSGEEKSVFRLGER